MINFVGENFYDFHRLVYRFPLSIATYYNSNSECIAMYVQVLAIILVTI